ncbi:MAG: metal ABC transporter permease [Anaerolineae bacterium]
MNELAAWVADPFTYPFMQRGLGAALIVGSVVPILGTYVVLRGMAFFGDALAHIVLPGVVVSFLLGWPLAVGALIVGVLAALAVGLISDRTAIRQDTAIGVIFAGGFALGVALISLQRSYAVDLAHILFGNLLGVSQADLLLMSVLAATVLLTIALLYKEFLILSFDRVLARTMQLPVALLNNLLLVLLAVVIVISVQVVGVALVLAMLVTPPAAAMLFTRRLSTMMFASGVIGSFSGIAGLYLSFYGGVASGPAIVLVATAVFGLAFLLAPGRGVLRSRVRADPA